MTQSSQNNSFIPKHSPITKPRSNKKDSSALFSIISSSIFGAVLIASFALLTYEWYLSGQFDKAELDLNKAVRNFSQSDLVRVVEFDARLTEANDLFSEHISTNRALEELARLTVSSVQFTRVLLERTSRTTLLVKADVSANELGSVLVQRNTYQDGEIFNDVAFEDLKLNFNDSNQPSAIASNKSSIENNFVDLTIELEFPIDSILYDGVRNLSVTDVTTFNPSILQESALESETTFDNINL